MLIRRTERQTHRGALVARLQGQSENALDRRTFLRRSGLAAGSLAALGALPLGERAQGEGRSAAGCQARQVTIRKSICTHCCGRLHRHRRSLERRVDRPGAELGQSRSTAARIAPRAPRCASWCTATGA